MKMTIYEIHEAVFDICFEHYVDVPSEKFILRKSNRYDRLAHGHWFYGNDNYVAVSFWSGSDWKNKTPNIFFGIDKGGTSYIELTATDSEKKFLFLSEIIAKNIIGFVPFRKGYRKYFPSYGDHFVDSLKSFMGFEKSIIDMLIKIHAPEYFSQDETTFNRIGFIEALDFERRLENVIKYRAQFDPKNIRKILPEHLKAFSFNGSFPKINISMENLPSTAQWIFLTGLNGTGKTNVLRAIAVAFFGNYDNHFLLRDSTFKLSISIRRKSKLVQRHFTAFEKRANNKLPVGFAAYGASRLNIMDFNNSQEMLSDVIRKCSPSYSIFNHDGILFTLDPIFLNSSPPELLKNLNPNKKLYNGFLVRFMEQIFDILPHIIPKLVSIIPPEKSNTLDFWSHVEYIEEDEQGEKLPPVDFQDLSTGAKSMIAMFGDMLIRLSSQQQQIEDLSELSGIVLIDEIDIHLHPRYQRSLVENLTGIFPKVQFIVTTHSPIPLLGAPKGSVFFRVDRTAKDGINLCRLNRLENEIGNLLPNTILTSPIFEMETLIPNSNEEKDELIIDDNYYETQLMDVIERKIEQLLAEGKK